MVAAMAVTSLMLLVVWMAMIIIQKHESANGIKMLQQQAQTAGLENIQIEISEKEVTHLSLYADQPDSMNMKTLYTTLQNMKALDESKPAWKIENYTINGKDCLMGDGVMKLDGREVYKTEKYKKEEKIRQNKPYVGMPAEYIEKTCLGKPDKKHELFEKTDDGNEIPYTRYDWSNSYGDRTYSVVVKSVKKSGSTKSDEVVQVMKFETPNHIVSPEKNESSYGSYSYTPGGGQSGDKYHAKKYKTAEDFYDDNYDNFFSYEDAEGYYEKHK